MHEMSARLAARNEPLMDYIRDVIGPTAAKPFALGIAFIMQFWSVANYALSRGLHWSLSPRFRTCTWGLSSWPRSVSRSSNSASTVVSRGHRDARAGDFRVLSGHRREPPAPLGGVALGFVPTISGDIGYLTMIISLVGTTVYYPNFFIQTSMQHEKDWTDVSRYRKDHTVGLAAVVALSATVIIAAAIAVPDETLHAHRTRGTAHRHDRPVGARRVRPRRRCRIVHERDRNAVRRRLHAPQSYGLTTNFGDIHFRQTVHFLIGLSVLLAIPILAFTDFTPVKLALLMPAVNGVVGLPITALALFAAIERHFDPNRLERAVFLAAVVLMFLVSLVTAQSLVQSIVKLL